MSDPADLVAADLAWAHPLNQANAVALSDMTADAFAGLVARARFARAIRPDAAFLLAFDQRPAAVSPNFDWFQARYADFLYLDRVAVDARHRRKGLAERLYRDLFDRAGAAGYAMIGCEVNADPPNPASDAFHEALGFEIVGEAHLADRGKTVRYMRRPLA